MTLEEFLVFRDVKIKNCNHERIVRLFFGYVASVTGNKRLLPDLLGQLLGMDLSDTTVATGCFNGIFDGVEPPYEGVDFYVRLQNGVRVYVYGSIPCKELKELKDNEYVLIMLSDDFSSNIERKAGRHICIT
jgi:hypothetical protein